MNYCNVKNMFISFSFINGCLIVRKYATKCPSIIHECKPFFCNSAKSMK